MKIPGRRRQQQQQQPQQQPGQQQLLTVPPDKLQLLQFHPSSKGNTTTTAKDTSTTNNANSAALPQPLIPQQSQHNSRIVRPIRPKLLKRVVSAPTMADQTPKNGSLLLKVRVIKVRHAPPSHPGSPSLESIADLCFSLSHRVVILLQRIAAVQVIR
jgi:hypothetical protein